METTFTQISSIQKWRKKSSKLKLLSFFTTLCCVLIFNSTSYSQDNCKTNCNANEVRVRGAFIGNSSGGTITCSGNEETEAFIFLRIFSNAPRTGVYFSANLLVNGSLLLDSDGEAVVLSECLTGPLSKDEYSIKRLTDPITFNCGDELALTNVYVAYSPNGDHCARVDPSCPGAPSKCRDQIEVGDPDIDIDPGPQCSFNVVCPVNTNLGSFNCNTLGNIPALPTTLNALTAAPYNITLANNLCSTVKFTASDNATPITCGTANQIITRTITIYDDLNSNNTADEDEIAVTCTFTLTIERDITAPTITTFPSNETVSCASEVPAANIALVTATDNCGGTVRISHFGDVTTAGSCTNRYSIARTYRATDACGNITDRVQTITVNDQTGPVITLSNCNTSNLGWNPTASKITAAFGSASATDNCGGTVTLVSETTADVVVTGCLRTQTRTWIYKDACDNRTTASCMVSWMQSPSNACYTADLLSSVFENGKTTFRIKLCATGNCTALSYVAFLTGREAVPAQAYGTNYKGCNRLYKVQRPVSKNVNGIKFESTGEGIKNGLCDIFEFELTGNQTGLTIEVELKGGPKEKSTFLTLSPNCARTGTSADESCDNVTTQRNVDAVIVEQGLGLKVKAFPNPYTDNVRFTVESPVSGQGSLEVFNVLGQRVKTVFQGTFVTGTQSFELNVPSAHRSTLVYVLRVGDKQITGKILNANRQ